MLKRGLSLKEMVDQMSVSCGTNTLTTFDIVRLMDEGQGLQFIPLIRFLSEEEYLTLEDPDVCDGD